MVESRPVKPFVDGSIPSMPEFFKGKCMSIESNNPIIIPCPPLSNYKEQPKDQSVCTAEPCPLCKENMWLSLQKKAMIEAAELAEREIFLACYHCITRALEKSDKFKDLFKKSHYVNL